MGESMLAAVYHGAHDVRVEEVPVPQVGAGELLVRVRSASVCGTDLRIYHGSHRKYPPGTVRIPGHEVVGVIAALGAGVDGYRVGEKVFIAPNMGCGHCRQCVSGNNNLCASYDAIGVTLDGGFAEYVRIPAQAVLQGNVMPVAEEVDAAVAALIEPFACVLRGQRPLHIRPGDVVLVMGAGPIGIMHLMLAKLSGAARVLVSEPAAERLAQAAQLGADAVINPAEADVEVFVRQESGGRGADVVIVAAPAHKAQEQALQLAAISGRINFFGGLPKDRPTILFDSNLLHYKELLVTATTACSTYDCRQAADIVNSGRIDLSPLISRRFALRQALEAFAAAEDGKALKVVIEP
ncbi:MAG: alcohol dehydrogenase catalytic domain-containing protein [Anaerolineae bacterium]|nr:alcohol dehydrogenase catalytic domain-containing protein [Anaerolineae bacterium]